MKQYFGLFSLLYDGVKLVVDGGLVLPISDEHTTGCNTELIL